MEPTEHTDGNTDRDALDAYSQVVSGVAEQLTPRVAAIRVRQGGPRGGEGAGSAVVPDRRRPPAHQRARGRTAPTAGQAAFADGTVATVQVIAGRDPCPTLPSSGPIGALPAPPEYGDADQLKVGSLVVAIGNPLGLADA